MGMATQSKHSELALVMVKARRETGQGFSVCWGDGRIARSLESSCYSLPPFSPPTDTETHHDAIIDLL